MKFRCYDSFFPRANASCISANSLPKLRSISVSYFMLVLPVSSFIPLEVGRHLQYFQGSVTPECIDAVAKWTGLRSCEISLNLGSVEAFFQAVPFLEKLHVSSPRAERPHFSHTKMRELCLKPKCLPSLQNLTHLGGFLFWTYRLSSATEPLSDIDEKFIGALGRLTKLKYVEINPWHERWVELKRSADGTYEGYEELPQETISIYTWGGFFWVPLLELVVNS